MGLPPEALATLQAPAKVEELGIPIGLAEDLFARRVFSERITTVGAACKHLGIAHSVGNQIAAAMRDKALLEYQGLDGRDYKITLTEQGFQATSERMKGGRHLASMPITIEDYRQVVELQHAEVNLNREIVKRAYGDMVVEDSILDQIGPAFVNGGAIFIYGPPGTGKTSLAERMSRFYGDVVLIPRFVYADGELINIYDPSLHVAVENQPAGLDPRYVLCERPIVVVGGELTLDMMDLRYDPISGLSAAPIQMLANNGILVVDDFGRQKTTPEEILNRWILPLSRGVDFLRPNSGTKFTVPFELKLVISTNLDPEDLGDDAFLRRLRNKVYVGPCTAAAFNWILVRSADRHGLEVTSDSAAHLIAVTQANLGELRPYVAIDFCELAVSICEYDRLPKMLDRSLIDRVAGLCFVTAGPPIAGGTASGAQVSPAAAASGVGRRDATLAAQAPAATNMTAPAVASAPTEAQQVVSAQTANPARPPVAASQPAPHAAPLQNVPAQAAPPQ